LGDSGYWLLADRGHGILADRRYRLLADRGQLCDDQCVECRADCDRGSGLESWILVHDIFLRACLDRSRDDNLYNGSDTEYVGYLFSSDSYSEYGRDMEFARYRFLLGVD